MDSAALLENYRVIFEAVVKAKPETSKGNFLKNIVMAATMGPGVKVELK
jgi:large subunit ribosomal protein L1